jgi:SAM-dependent methyltransferase
MNDSMGESEDISNILSRVYEQRFTPRQIEAKRVLWSVLVTRVFQRYVPVDGTVLDLGAGRCEFSNAIQAKRRIAVDLDPATARYAEHGVEVLQTRASDLSPLGSSTVDCVFSSNFFEHLQSKAELLATLTEAHRVLAPEGTVVVLMPNIRYLPGAYWDYLDHHLPLTDRSLAEALRLTGFEVVRSVARFLPYTVRDRRFPVRGVLVHLYLSLPFVWRVLGRQMLLVARRA